MGLVVDLFLCLLFLPFSLLQSSTARDKDEQALPVGGSGSVYTCPCACGECGTGVGGGGLVCSTNHPPPWDTETAQSTGIYVYSVL